MASAIGHQKSLRINHLRTYVIFTLYTNFLYNIHSHMTPSNDVFIYGTCSGHLTIITILSVVPMVLRLAPCCIPSEDVYELLCRIFIDW